MKQEILGIDYGTRKSGLAVLVEGFAFSIGTVPTHDLETEIMKIIETRKIAKIVLGMPYHIDGSMSEHGRKVEAFRTNLSRRISIPIEYFDERLTSAEARMTFGEEGINGDIDAESARLILERYEKSDDNVNSNH